MNREIKNDGVYVEIPADEIIDRIEEIKKADVVVLTKMRIEMAGEEKNEFLRKFEQILEIVDADDRYSGLNSRQKSDVVVRSFLL